MLLSLMQQRRNSGLLPCVQLFAVSWLLLKKTKAKTWVLETMNAYRYMPYFLVASIFLALWCMLFCYSDPLW
jgi:hypothetical protein